MIRSPSTWEADVVGEVRGKARRMSESTRGLHYLGWTPEDLENELLLGVIDACRRYAETSSDRPPSSLLGCAMRRTRMKVWTKIRVRARAKERLLEEAKAEESTTIPLNVEIEDRDAAQTVISALSVKLSPTDFALLQARAQGYMPRDLAGDLGMTNREVQERHYLAKRRAIEFLGSCGIGSVWAAMDAAPETLEVLFDAALDSTHSRNSI